MTEPTPNPHQEPAPAGRPSAASFERAKSPYSFREKVMRVIWDSGGQVLFRLSFHNWYSLRSGLLRVFGANIAPNVRLRPSVRVEIPWNLTIDENTAVGDNVVLYCLAPVRIGHNCTISQYSHLCAGTHDHTRPDMPLVTKPVVLEPEVWIAADVFVGPGVTVGTGSVVGARSSVFSNLEPWGIYTGAPARRVRDRELKQ